MNIKKIIGGKDAALLGDFCLIFLGMDFADSIDFKQSSVIVWPTTHTSFWRSFNGKCKNK